MVEAGREEAARLPLVVVEVTSMRLALAWTTAHGLVGAGNSKVH